MIIDYIKAFIPKSFLLLQLFHADERLWVFVFRAFGLGLTSPVSLDGRKDSQYVKSTWSILHSEVKAYILLPLEANNKGLKMDKHIHTVQHLSQNAVKH